MKGVMDFRRIIQKNELEMCGKKHSNITEITPIPEGHTPETFSPSKTWIFYGGFIDLQTFAVKPELTWRGSPLGDLVFNSCTNTMIRLFAQNVGGTDAWCLLDGFENVSHRVRQKISMIIPH